MRIFDDNEIAQKWETATSEFLADLSLSAIQSMQEGFTDSDYITKAKAIYDKLFQALKEVIEIDMKAPTNDNL